MIHIFVDFLSTGNLSKDSIEIKRSVLFFVSLQFVVPFRKNSIAHTFDVFNSCITSLIIPFIFNLFEYDGFLVVGFVRFDSFLVRVGATVIVVEATGIVVAVGFFGAVVLSSNISQRLGFISKKSLKKLHSSSIRKLLKRKDSVIWKRILNG